MKLLPQNGQIWPKTEIFGQILAFWAHLASWQAKKTMRTRCLGLPLPNLLLPPIEIKNFPPKYAFVVILDQILAFWPFWSHARPKNSAKKVRRCFFGPKKAKFGPIYAFLGTSRPCWFIWCRVGWWLWWAGCILQDNYILNDKVSAQTAS